MNTPKTYRKRPVEITAMQWALPTDNSASLLGWLDENECPYLIGDATAPETLRHPDGIAPTAGHYIRPDDGALMIRTLEGDMATSPGDYVIRGVAGEFYPCKPDIFAATYEEVTDHE